MIGTGAARPRGPAGASATLDVAVLELGTLPYGPSAGSTGAVYRLAGLLRGPAAS